MTADDIKLISETAAKVAVSEYKKQEEIGKAEFADKRIHNTKLLLKNYRQLKAHCEQAVFDSAQAVSTSDVVRELMSLRESSTITAIVTSVQKTHTLLVHVDKCLNIYKTQCEIYGKEQDRRGWRVINAMYLADEKQTAEELAELEFVEKRTIYHDIERAVEALSALLFGVFF